MQKYKISAPVTGIIIWKVVMCHNVITPKL